MNLGSFFKLKIELTASVFIFGILFSFPLNAETKYPNSTENSSVQIEKIDKTSDRFSPKVRKKHSEKGLFKRFFKFLFSKKSNLKKDKKKTPFITWLALMTLPAMIASGVSLGLSFMAWFTPLSFLIMTGIGLLIAKENPEKYEAGLSKALFGTMLFLVGVVVLISILVVLSIPKED